jgi:hypothetical protein
MVDLPRLEPNNPDCASGSGEAARAHRRHVDGQRNLDAVLKTSQQHLFLSAARDSCSLSIIVVVPRDASFEGGGSRGRSAIC